MRPLLHDDGENLAVRCFLMFYAHDPTLTLGEMMANMRNSGYPFQPDWVKEHDANAMTKAGAQDWLRYLFSLEKE